LNEKTPEPAAVDTAPPRAAEAPAAGTARAPRRGPAWKRALAAVFVHDLPLKGLALVLAVLAWQLVREQVITPIVVSDISVEVTEIPPDVAVIEATGRRVRISLRGTRAEVERARALLESEPRIKVSLPELPKGVDSGTTAPIKHPSDFVYPFERADLVTGVDDPVVIEWVRLAERTVPVLAPEVSLKPGTPLEPAPGWPTLDTTKVKVRGPKSVVEGLSSVQPDPIDPSAWLAQNPDLASLYSWTSGFETWRGTSPLRTERVLTIDPATVKGRLKLRPVAAPRAVEHALRLVLPPGAADALAAWDVVVEGGPEYDRSTRRIRLTLKGEKKALDEIEASPDDWSYVVEVPPPSDSGDPVEKVSVPVRLLLGTHAATGKALGAGVVLDGTPMVQITLRRKT
jgi:hypothetical protein